jgi:hypothetical protein
MGYRIDSRRQHNKNKEHFEKAQARQYNGQMRGDLGQPDKHDKRYNYNTYKEDYFSGAQCKVYFGDIWVDDVITIQYNTSQGKQPLYGYASQNFDAVAMGTVIGQGTLTIAFKEVGYLNVVKAILDQQALGINKAIDNVTSRITNAQEDAISSNVRTTSGLKGVINPNLTPSLIRKEETVENILDNLKGLNRSPYNRDANTNIEGNLFINDKEHLDFEDVAEVFEDSIWGDSNGVPFGSIRNKMLRADEFDYFYNKFNALGIKSAHNDDEYGKVLNLMLTFGDINDFRGEHTLVLLNDVHFTSQGLVSAPNGEPIAETYSFFFRDINKSVSQSTWGTMNPLKFHIGTDNPIDLATLKDVDTIEEMIDSHGAGVTIKILSGWDGDKWIPRGDIIEADFELQRLFFIGPHGASQSLNKYVEEAMQTHYLKRQRATRPIKVAIEVTTEPLSYGSEQKFNYILEQHGDNTSVYRVISPTRDDFHSLNLVRREDFFPPPSLPSVPDGHSPMDLFNSDLKKVDETGPGGVEGEEFKISGQTNISNESDESRVTPGTYDEIIQDDNERMQQILAAETDPIPDVEDPITGKYMEEEYGYNDTNYTNGEGIDPDTETWGSGGGSEQIDETSPGFFERVLDEHEEAERNQAIEDRTIIPPDDLTGDIDYKSWSKEPEGEYSIGISHDPKEHSGRPGDKYSNVGAVDTVFFNTESDKMVTGQQLPFESSVLHTSSVSALLSTPYKYGEEREDIALYLYHYDITKEYSVGDVIPEKTFFGQDSFQYTHRYPTEHAHWQIKVRNASTGKYENLDPRGTAFVFNEIFGSEYDIYSDNPDQP